ncbi:armadillo-type protein [Powellomyces hirtus]|nr:armadillo-type protein [Powellomyces hirtus]
MTTLGERAYGSKRAQTGPDSWPLANKSGSRSVIGPAYAKYDVLERLPQAVGVGNPLLPSCPTSYFMQLSRTWDRGNRPIREKILQEFVKHNRNKTGPQLEREFSNGASLFLTRLSAYLRLSYLLGHSLALQMQAINIFISASSGHRFLAEFLEVGGVLTVLEILGLAQVKEPDKAEALRILLSVAQAGRRYKEFICESYGVRAVADCLGRSRSEITQDYARNLLHQLGVGNPKFLMQVYKSLLSLLTSQGPSPTSQQMAGQALRMLLPSIQAVHPSIVEATVALLKNPHIQIQYEGYEILRELSTRAALQDVIITQLITILKTSIEDVQEDLPEDRRRRGKADAKSNIPNQWGGLVKSDESKAQSEAILAGYMQQAYSAKLLGAIAATNRELAEKMIDAQIVSGLLSVIANVGHADSQHYAASALLFLVGNFEYVATALREHMGQNFFDLLQDKPDTFYKELNREQVRYLRRNNVQIHGSSNGLPSATSLSEYDESYSSDEEANTANPNNNNNAAPQEHQPRHHHKTRPKSGRPAHSAGSSREGGAATPFDMFPATRDGDGARAESNTNNKQLQDDSSVSGAPGDNPAGDEGSFGGGGSGGGDNSSQTKPPLTATTVGGDTSQTVLDLQQLDRASPPAAVQDLYVPFAQPVMNATFSAQKFGKADALESRELFDADLQKFRATELAGQQRREVRKEQVPMPEASEAWLNKMKNADFNDIKMAVVDTNSKTAPATARRSQEDPLSTPATPPSPPPPPQLSEQEQREQEGNGKEEENPVTDTPPSQ